MKNGKKIPGQQRGHKPGGDNPAKDATDQPIGLPGPLSDAPVWRVETAGSEAAQPMEDNSQRRVSIHRLSRSGGIGLVDKPTCGITCALRRPSPDSVHDASLPSLVCSPAARGQ